MLTSTFEPEPRQGPAWSSAGLAVAAGRYPLSVERHVMRMVDHLVPGVTALTPHGRYYALHALLAAEATAGGLDEAGSQQLLRRAEVAMALASYAHHPEDLGWLPRAHGLDALARRLHGGAVDVAEAATPGPGGYASSAWGFWRPYAGSEASLGIVADTARPIPGPALDDVAVRAVRDGLGPLLELAREDQLRVEELHEVAEQVCVCAGAQRSDGPWLAALMCGRGAETGSRADARRQTVQLLARVVETHPVARFTRDVSEVIAFGPFLAQDPTCAALTTAPIWRGVVLRNHAVGAWRRLWSWLVEQVVPVEDTGDLLSAADLAERFAAQLPDISVQAFLTALPPTQDPAGVPLPAEQQLRSGPALPLAALQVLAASAGRVEQLQGEVRDAFLGQRGVELGPEWMQRRLEEARPQPVRDFARHLTTDLLARSQRVALSKASRRPDGSLWLPTRLHQRGELLFRTSTEGRGDVGLRLDQLGSVLASTGVFTFDDPNWSLTPRGRALLG